jgi:hypothetical protein
MSIFLSYSRGDAQQADDWVANLEKFGTGSGSTERASGVASNGMRRSCAR